jgi:hypothetical protein
MPISKGPPHPMPGTANLAAGHTRERMLSLAMLAATFAGGLETHETRIRFAVSARRCPHVDFRE